MSMVKDWLFDIEQERADTWIRERLEDDNADENSEEWQELELEYSNLQDHLMEEAQFESELQWLSENGSSIIHQNLMTELIDLKTVIVESSVNTSMVNKMSFAYAVTLLETFLGDTVKLLVMENDVYFKNAILEIDELKKAKYSLNDLAKVDNLEVKNLAVKKLSDIIYHNIPKVKQILEVILGEKITIDISSLAEIVQIRHDIVHRNGKTKEGIPVLISDDKVTNVIFYIENFSSELQAIINKA